MIDKLFENRELIGYAGSAIGIAGVTLGGYLVPEVPGHSFFLSYGMDYLLPFQVINDLNMIDYVLKEFTRFKLPGSNLLYTGLALGVAASVETSQYFNILQNHLFFRGTFDPFDYLAFGVGCSGAYLLGRVNYSS